MQHVAAVVEVEHFGQHHGADGHGAGGFEAGAVAQLPQKQAQRGAGHEHRDHHHTPDEQARQQRLPWVARAAAHDIALGRLKGQGHAQGAGGDQVDPQHLRRGERQHQAKGDGAEDDQRLAAVGGQHEQDEFAHVVVNAPALAHGVAQGGEVVVGQHHGGGIFGRFGAVFAHGHAHVGAFQGRGIVYAVAGHGDHFAVGLQGLHQAQLVLGAGAGKDIDIGHHVAQGGIVQQFDFGPCQRRFAQANAQLGTNGAGGFAVVAGDHLHANARCVAFGHGRHGFGAGRVHAAQQAKQGEAALHVRKLQRLLLRRHGFDGNGQDAQGAGGAVVGGAAPVVGVQRCGWVVPVVLGVAHVQHALGRTFDKHQGLARVLVVQRGHEAVCGLKRNRIGAGQAGVFGGRIQPGFQGQGEQCALGGVAGQHPAAVAFMQRRIVAQQGGAGDAGQGGVVVQRHIVCCAVAAAVQPAFGAVAAAADFVHLVGRDHALHRHFVAGEGAGFVRADDGDRAQRLHRRELANDGLVLRHAPHAQRQGDGHQGGQPLGDGRGGQGHGHHEHLGQGLAAPEHANGEGEHNKADDDQRQPVAKAGHLAQQRRGGGLHRGQQGADAAQLRGAARGHDQPRGRARGHQRARVQHAVPVAQGGILGHRARVLVAGQGFAGQHRLIGPQALGVQDAQIGGHLVARGQQHHIARHQGLGIHHRPHAAAQHRGLQRQHAPDGIERGLGLAFLQKANQRIDEHRPQQHARIQPVPQRGGDHGGHQHHVNQDVVKLQQQPQPHRAFALLRQAIGAVRGQALGGLGGSESVGGVAALPLHSGGAVQAVPGSSGAGRGARRGGGGWQRTHGDGGCVEHVRGAFDGDGSHHFVRHLAQRTGHYLPGGRPKIQLFPTRWWVRWSFMLGWLF